MFDSQYGNTERIARAIADGIGEDARVERIREDACVEPGVALL